MDFSNFPAQVRCGNAFLKGRFELSREFFHPRSMVGYRLFSVNIIRINDISYKKRVPLQHEFCFRVARKRFGGVSPLYFPFLIHNTKVFNTLNAECVRHHRRDEIIGTEQNHLIQKPQAWRSVNNKNIYLFA